MIAGWLFVTAVALGASLGLFGLAAWRVHHEAQADRQTDAGTTTTTTVQCQNCGTTNEQGYTYCQACLEALPGGTATVPDSLGTTDRPLR